MIHQDPPHVLQKARLLERCVFKYPECVADSTECRDPALLSRVVEQVIYFSFLDHRLKGLSLRMAIVLVNAILKLYLECCLSISDHYC